MMTGARQSAYRAVDRVGLTVTAIDERAISFAGCTGCARWYKKFRVVCGRRPGDQPAL